MSTRPATWAVVLAVGVAAAVSPALTASAPAGALPPTPASAAEVLAAARAPGARAVVVNIWATWCVPCREEMPDLLRLRRTYADRGLRLILVSGDFASDADQAAAFLRELGVDFPTYRKEGDDMQFINALDPRWSGALPASFIYDGRGHLQESIYGKSSYEKLETSIKPLIANGR